jgi:ankyrin repeat protein
MIRPIELGVDYQIDLSYGERAGSFQVWEMLIASRNGDFEKVKELSKDCPGLLYAQYNYTSAIHFAVREGHTKLVQFLLENGAHDPEYKIYPFLDPLIVIAGDRGHLEIVDLLQDYYRHPGRCKYKGDNGAIHYMRTQEEKDFETAVDRNEIDLVKKILLKHPGFAKNETFFWSEGIMMRPAKENHREMVDLLLSYGARIPPVLKWAQFYYFEKYEMAVYLMELGLNPNVMSWHHVSILHDMAQKGNLPKAALLIKHGAHIDALEEEYCSTPLGMAARWGHMEMVEYLISEDADLNKAAAPWATPLQWARKKGHEGIAEMLLRAGARY